jgi:hypothetical protein
MKREPAKAIPKGIVNARQLINDLARDLAITISATNPYWTETQLSSNPFTTRVSYDRENIEMCIEVSIGRVFDSSVANELNEMLPIPVNLQFSLEPQPRLFVSESLAVTPATKKNELNSFISGCIIKSLMIVQALLVTDGFTSDEKNRWENSILPPAQSLWDFSGLTSQVLSSNAQ